MYQTECNGKRYCFYDDRMTVNSTVIWYEEMNNIRHRGGDSPAFVFEYKGRNFALPYPATEMQQILPYMQLASKTVPAPQEGLLPVEDIPATTAATATTAAAAASGGPVRSQPGSDEPIFAEPVDIPPQGAQGQYQQGAQGPYYYQAPPVQPKKSRKKGCLIVVGIVVALLIALGACMAIGGDTDPDDSDKYEIPDTTVTLEEPDYSDDSDDSTATGDGDLSDLSTEERNAYASATSYLSIQGFSRKGLIDQLKYEQYSDEACEKAVSTIEKRGEVNWEEECLESAENYMSIMSFSKQELIDQLKYEGFTDDQINAIIDEAYK